VRRRHAATGGGERAAGAHARGRAARDLCPGARVRVGVAPHASASSSGGADTDVRRSVRRTALAAAVAAAGPRVVELRPPHASAWTVRYASGATGNGLTEACSGGGEASCYARDAVPSSNQVPTDPLSGCPTSTTYLSPATQSVRLLPTITCHMRARGRPDACCYDGPPPDCHHLSE
jgi:hypothetical protein